MVDLSILKNPIIIGILGAAVTYLYMYWENEQKYENDPKADKKPVSFWPALIVGAIAWLIAYGFLNDNSNKELKIDSEVMGQNSTAPLPEVNSVKPAIGGAKIDAVTGKFDIGTTGTPASIGSESYHFIGRKNLRLPATDVFIDIAEF